MGPNRNRCRWVFAVLAGAILVAVQACTSGHSVDPTSTSTSSVSAAVGPGIFTGDPCDLVTAKQFTSVLGPKVGPGKNTALPLPKGITGRTCSAINDNDDLIGMNLLHYSSTTAATSAYQGVTTGPSLGRQVALTPGLAPRQFADILIQGGVNASAYLLDGRNELVLMADTTTADESLFSKTAFVQTVEDAARRWRHP
jgi:hypothetical protein